MAMSVSPTYLFPAAVGISEVGPCRPVVDSSIVSLTFKLHTSTRTPER